MCRAAQATTVYPLDRATILAGSPFDFKVELNKQVKPEDVKITVADNEREVAHMRHAELRPIPSIWGHRAGNPTENPEGDDFIDRAVKELLGR